MHRQDRVGLVLVASILNRPRCQRARVIRTVSAGAGAPGVTVSVVVLVTPNQRAVIVAVIVRAHRRRRDRERAVEAPPLTNISDGTPTAGLLLASWTSAPSVARVKRTVPVAALPPVTDVGATLTDDAARRPASRR